DEWIIQVQPDRFYVNWRRRTGAYPRFSDHDGKEGVLTRSLREFKAFATYCKAELQADVIAGGVDLAKVDLIVEGKHGRDFQDLGAIMPLMADIGRFMRSSAPEVAFKLSEPAQEGGFLQTSLSLATESTLAGGVARAVKLETRGRRRLP